MSHNVALGAYNSIKQSKSGICLTEVIGNSTIGEIVLKFTCPAQKIWLIQQLSAYNSLEPSARICAFYIYDELNTFVNYLSNTGRAKQSVSPLDAATYDGFGLSFVPEGRSIAVRWFGLTVVGSVAFYAHLTEIDLN